MSKKPTSIAGLAQAKTAQKAEKQQAVPTEYKFVQVRLTAEDAKRFRRAAEDNAGLTLQAAMVEAVNAIMASWGESPVSDPGTQLRAKRLSPGPEEN